MRSYARIIAAVVAFGALELAAIEPAGAQEKIGGGRSERRWTSWMATRERINNFNVTVRSSRPTGHGFVNSWIVLIEEEESSRPPDLS